MLLLIFLLKCQSPYYLDQYKGSRTVEGQMLENVRVLTRFVVDASVLRLGADQYTQTLSMYLFVIPLDQFCKDHTNGTYVIVYYRPQRQYKIGVYIGLLNVPEK